MTNTERNLKLAKECGAVTLGDQSYFTGKDWKDDPRVVITGEQLDDYTARICDEKDAEIARLKESEACWIANAKSLQQGYNELDAKHRTANAAIAMKDEALNSIMSAYAYVKSLEARIKASQEQEPVAYANTKSFNDHSFAVVRGRVFPDDVPVYSQPIIPPEVAELQELLELYKNDYATALRENADLTRKLAEQQAVNYGRKVIGWIGHNHKFISLPEHATKHDTPIFTIDLENPHAELTKLLEEAKRQVVPEGWKLVPIDARMDMVIAASELDWSQSDTIGNIYNMWNVMLSAAPQPERKTR